MKYPLLFACVLLMFCDARGQGICPEKKSVAGRFIPPEGFTRRFYPRGSFQEYLRSIPLKKYGVPVMLYNGLKKEKDVHASVLDIPLLKEDLIQCADAIILLRSRYLFDTRRYGDIAFSLTNRMRVPFRKYAGGYRIKISGNNTSWKRGGHKKGYTREVLDEYLRFIYTYAGTMSLANDLRKINISEIEIGDVFIQGGSPGHAVIVMDLAENRGTGRKIILLAQSYMPSQEMHIVKSFSDISPWYHVEDDDLVTPEWHFPGNSLKRFR